MTAQLDENPASLADQALARAWRALTPEGFAQFSTMAALMGYLRACVYSTVVDATRAQVRADRERAQPGLEDAVLASPEQVVLDKLSYIAVWRAILRNRDEPCRAYHFARWHYLRAATTRDPGALPRSFP